MKKLILFGVMCLMALTMNAQKCAVLEFRGSASVSLADIDGISEMFMTYFRPAGYTMVERAQIDKIISEQQFQRSNITDDQAVIVGKILNASVVILGKVSMLGGEYQVDVRAVDVQSGHDIVFDGATFSGEYRTNVRNLATRLANQIAITPEEIGSVVPIKKTRASVEMVYGYLKIYPTELGVFEAEPTSIIAQINKQIQHGYNNWRIPTNEELSLLRSNGYLDDVEYMTREKTRGVVLLVSDGDDYETMQNKIQQEKEALITYLLSHRYVDLGLPSGTFWNPESTWGCLNSSSDENNNFKYFDSRTFLIKHNHSKYTFPTTSQMTELLSYCQVIIEGNSYIFTGPNGNKISLPIKSTDGLDCYYISMGEDGYPAYTIFSDEYHRWLTYGTIPGPCVAVGVSVYCIQNNPSSPAK